MKNHLKHFLLLVVLALFCTATAVAQATLKGKVVDAESNEPLIGATVSVKGIPHGVVTDIDGLFSLKVSKSNATVVIQYLGYKTEEVKVSKKGNVDLGNIGLRPDSKMLGDVVVTSSMAVARKTPVAVSTVALDFIEENLVLWSSPKY